MNKKREVEKLKKQINTLRFVGGHERADELQVRLDSILRND